MPCGRSVNSARVTKPTSFQLVPGKVSVTTCIAGPSRPNSPIRSLTAL